MRLPSGTRLSRYEIKGPLLFAPAFNRPLFKVGASGGKPVAITQVDTAAGDSSNRFPQFLSDGERYLYFIRKRSEVGNRTVLGSLNVIMKIQRIARSISPLVFSVAIAASIVVAQGVHADGPAECTALLTAAELQAASELPIDETADPVLYSEGHSSCSWFAKRADNQVIVSLDFWNLYAIREGMIPSDSVAGYFDMNVSSMSDVSRAEPQPLKGIGVRAVLFTEAERLTVYIETPAGFAELRAVGLTRERVEALAKAVARKGEKGPAARRRSGGEG